MKQVLLSCIALLFLYSCNQNSPDKPDAERVIKDTVAQILLQPFDAAPKQQGELIKVLTSEDHTPRMQNMDLQGFMAHFKIPVQHFTIDNTVAVQVKAQQGTTVAFNANAFIDEKGNAVTTPINLEIKECFNGADMLREYLGSRHEQILESRGLVYVQAYSGGRQLQLKKGQLMKIGFPFAVNSKAGYMFYNSPGLNTANNKWLAVSETHDFTTAAVPGMPGKIRAEKPEFNYSGLKLEEYLLQIMHYPEYAKTNELSAKVEATIQIDENGKVAATEVNSDYVVFKDEIARTLQNLPDWKPAMLNSANIPSSVKVRFDFNLRRSNQILVAMDVNEITYMPKAADGDITVSGGNNTDVHTRSFSGMGWFNYSKKAKMIKPGADVVVQADANTDVRIICKSGKSIITGENCIGYSRFRNLPVNTEIQVFCIKYENGKAYYALQPLKLQQQNVILPQWKPTTEKELARIFKQVASV